MCHYMRTLIIILTFLTLTLYSTAQEIVSHSYDEISKIQFDSCQETSYLIKNSQINKIAGELKILISCKPAKTFKDNNTNENFNEYEYLGDIKKTKLSLVKRTDYNSEEFYLINRSSGFIDTLIGQPVFAQNMRDFACINNPKTDEKQQIQICKIINDSVKTKAYINGKSDTFFEYISCVKQNSLLTKDIKGNFWKLSFIIREE